MSVVPVRPPLPLNTHTHEHTHRDGYCTVFFFHVYACTYVIYVLRTVVLHRSSATTHHVHLNPKHLLTTTTTTTTTETARPAEGETNQV